MSALPVAINFFERAFQAQRENPSIVAQGRIKNAAKRTPLSVNDLLGAAHDVRVYKHYVDWCRSLGIRTAGMWETFYLETLKYWPFGERTCDSKE
jgi:hypothetical protein